MSPTESKRSSGNNTVNSKKESEPAMSSVSTTEMSDRNEASAHAPATAPEAAPEGTAPSSFSLLFNRVETAAKALPESELRVVDTDVYVVASGVTLRLPKLNTLRPRFVYHQFPLEPFDNLGDYAAVASDAYVAHQPNSQRAAEASALLEASVPIFEHCTTEVTFLVMRGRATREELGKVSGRKSFRNHSEGITRCCRIMERELDYLIECKSTITKEDIAHYMEVARALSTVVGERETVAPVVEEKPVTDDMMTRTFTLFDKAMDSVRAGLNYIFQDTPEKVEEYLPRKVKKPSTAKPKKTAPVEKPPEGQSKPDAQNGASPSPTPSANGNVQAPTGSAVGNVQAPDARREDRAAE